MNKGLEALKRIKSRYNDRVCIDILEDFDLVEKELKDGEKNKKALEIIKEKVLDIQTLIRTNNAVEYNSYVVKGYGEKDLTQEEYELLKEVLL